MIMRQRAGIFVLIYDMSFIALSYDVISLLRLIMIVHIGAIKVPYFHNKK